MSKVAWVFPGQGSQAVGMGKGVRDSFAAAKDVFEAADKALGFSLTKVIFEGPADTLTLTEYAQPALLTVSAACAAVLTERGLEPDMVAGLSLGEYTALVISGSLTLEDAVALVRNRGIYMREACPPGDGAMAAIIGLGAEAVEEMCGAARGLGEVAGANFNCPGQIVVSGKRAAVEAVMLSAKARSAKVIPLNVSAPFHCALMAPAAEKLKADLDRLHVKKPRIPVYSNVHGGCLYSASDVKEALVAQVTMPVLWQKCAESMARDGAGAFVEVGAGKTLTGFGKRIHPGMPYAQFGEAEDLDAAVAFSKEALLR